MDNAIRKFLFKKNTLGKFSTLDLMAIFFFSLFAILVRICFFDFQSSDWYSYLEPWTAGFQNEGFNYIAGNQYNYAPFYMYYLWFTTKTGLPVLLQIKILSVVVDFAAALFAARIIYRMTNKKTTSILTYGIVILTPTVIMNSAMWGQCDSIYVMFILASFYYLLKNRINTAMILYGLSFCLKLQSIFAGLHSV